MICLFPRAFHIVTKTHPVRVFQSPLQPRTFPRDWRSSIIVWVKLRSLQTDSVIASISTPVTNTMRLVQCQTSQHPTKSNKFVRDPSEWDWFHNCSVRLRLRVTARVQLRGTKKNCGVTGHCIFHSTHLLLRFSNHKKIRNNLRADGMWVQEFRV